MELHGTVQSRELTSHPMFSRVHCMTKTIRSIDPSSPRFRRTWLLMAVLSVAACSDSTGPVFTLWEGDLQPLPTSTLEGSVAAASQFGRTEASIELRQAEAGATYGWRIESGSCQAPGEIQAGPAVYPPMTADEAGTASEDAVIGVVFKSNSRIIARVFRTLGAGGEEILACGEFREIG